MLVGVGVWVLVGVGVCVLVGVGVFVLVDVGVGVLVGVDVLVGVAVAVGVAVCCSHGGKLADFALSTSVSTRIVLTPLRIWLMSRGPKSTVLEFAMTVWREPGISRKKPSPGLWSVTQTWNVCGNGPGISVMRPTTSPLASHQPDAPGST